MRLFTRISTTVTAALDRAVGALENHDAVIEASIRDIRRAAAEARARLNRVRAESARMREKREALEASATRWQDRAVTDGVEEATALECLRRRRDCEAQRTRLAESLAQHESLEQRLVNNIERIEARLAELMRSRDVMRTRQATAEALRSAHTAGERAAMYDIDQTLERWDAQISEAELTLGAEEPEDTLERTFLAEEEHASLAAELDALKRAREGQS